MKKLFIALFVLCASCTHPDIGTIESIAKYSRDGRQCSFEIRWGDGAESLHYSRCGEFKVGDTVVIARYEHTKEK